MGLKIRAFFLYGMVNFFAIIFVIFNPNLVFDVKLETVNLVNPKFIIGNNGRIISFSEQDKQFDALCVKAKDINNLSICNYKNNIKNINAVLGCRPVTFLSKSRKINNIVIQYIDYYDNNGNRQVFRVSNACLDDGQEYRIYFYLFYFIINILLILYLLQFSNLKKQE